MVCTLLRASVQGSHSRVALRERRVIPVEASVKVIRWNGAAGGVLNRPVIARSNLVPAGIGS